MDGDISFRPIGVIHTPYRENAPYQPDESAEGEFRVVVNPVYADGLRELEKFRYVYLLYYLDRADSAVSTRVRPPWAGGKEVGLFASRSPVRPNPIGLSVVRLEELRGNEILVSGLDALDGSPVIDIKMAGKR